MGDVIKPLEGSRRNDEKAPQELLQLPSLMIGGAVFSYHYNEDVTKVPTEAILSQAIEAGANGEQITSLPRIQQDERLTGLGHSIRHVPLLWGL